MGALTFDALLRSLKPEGCAPDPVYYLHGDEDILKDEALRALTARAMEAAARDFNVDTRSAADLDAATLRALVDTPPLLAQTRVVVLRGIEQMRRGSKARQELLRYLPAPNPTTVLVLVQSAGEKHDPELARLATTVAVEPLPPERVARWVAHRAKQVGVEIEPDAIAALVGIARPRLGALAPELGKLAAGPPLRPRRLGRDGGQLGAVGGRMELQRAGAGAAAGPGCRSRPQVDDGHGRSGGRDAAGAAARRAAEGGGVNLAGGRMAGWAVSALGAVLLSAYPPIRLSAQSDPRLDRKSVV